MKIFYIANARIPTEKAHGIQIMKMCEAFADLGHTVTLMVPKRKNPITEDPFSYYNVRSNFTIARLWCLDTVRFGFLGFILEWISFAEMVFWRFLFEKNGLYFGRDYLALLYLSFFRKNVVWESHTGEWNFIVWLFTKLESRIVTISEGLKTFYISKGVSPHKIIVAHDAVDLNEFSIFDTKEEARRKIGLPLEKYIALYCGHLYASKGAHVLAEAAREFPSNFLGILLGGTDKDLAAFRERFSAVSTLAIIGRKPHGDVPLYLRAADVLVLPNTGEDAVSRYQTSPMKLFEYMASGRPIVASKLPSLLEILDDSQALLVHPGDSTALREGIERLFQNPSLGEALALASLAKVQEYTWDLRAKNILFSLDLYVSKDN